MLILPGVGAFDVGARALREHGFFDFIHEGVAKGHRLLGICLGMQLLCRGSEEGGLEGLGIIPAEVIRLDPASSDNALKVFRSNRTTGLLVFLACAVVGMTS